MLTRLSSCLLALCVGVVPALAQSAPAPWADVPHLEVVGHASEERAADRASVTVRVRAAGPTSEGVSRAVAVAAGRIAELVKAAGIEDADTTSEGPSVTPEYEDVQDASGREVRRQKGFSASYALTIDTPSLDALPGLVPKLGAVGGLVGSVGFSLGDRARRERELEEKAVAEGVERAGRLIRAAGSRPGRVLSIAVASAPGRGNREALPTRKAAPVAPGDVVIPLRSGRALVLATARVIVEIVAP